MNDLTPDYWGQAQEELSASDPVLAQIISNYPGELMKGRGDAFYTLARSITGQQISVKAADAVWGRLVAKLEGLYDPSPERIGGLEAVSKLSKDREVSERGQQAEPAVSPRSGRPCEIQQDSTGQSNNEEDYVTSSVAGVVSPEALRALTETELRTIGYSRQKVTYLHSLSEFFLERAHLERDWHRMDDEAIIQGLIQIRGIGRWSAEMFLIFYLQRPDILPLDDIGLLKAIGLHYESVSAAKAGRKEARMIAEKWSPWRSVATWYLWRSLDPVPVAY